jgi:UDP-N-acetylglucosamine 1-carboxyvinyltransferase
MSENFFKIRGFAGQRKLEGEISVGGAKNAALKVMAAAALFDDYVELSNVPEIEDVHRMGELLEGLGFTVEKKQNHRKIVAPRSIGTDLSDGPAKAMRSSIVATGPLLAKTGKVVFPNPGGCSFGNRPIDLFIDGFKRFGADIREAGETYVVTAPKGGLVGMEFFFKVQSHTGTETLMMAATLARGRTVLKNCALEPEVKSLADFLNSCGAQISGAGTPVITIEGVSSLKSGGKAYETMPDRIETGSFMILAALAGKKVTVQNCIPEHVEIVTEILRTAGARVEIGKDSITVYGAENLKAVNVRTHEYPGMATDVQAPMAVFLTQAAGESALFETIYEGRLGYIPDLVSMGANILAQDSHRVLIKGPTPLVGKKIKAPDLRAGFAFVIAAIIAEGESTIENAYVIDRGYERLAERLVALGVEIERPKVSVSAPSLAKA